MNSCIKGTRFEIDTYLMVSALIVGLLESRCHGIWCASDTPLQFSVLTLKRPPYAQKSFPFQARLRTSTQSCQNELTASQSNLIPVPVCTILPFSIRLIVSVSFIYGICVYLHTLLYCSARVTCIVSFQYCIIVCGRVFVYLSVVHSWRSPASGGDGSGRINQLMSHTHQLDCTLESIFISARVTALVNGYHPSWTLRCYLGVASWLLHAHNSTRNVFIDTRNINLTCYIITRYISVVSLKWNGRVAQYGATRIATSLPLHCCRVYWCVYSVTIFSPGSVFGWMFSRLSVFA